MNSPFLFAELENLPEQSEDAEVSTAIFNKREFDEARDRERPDSARRDALGSMIQSGVNRQLTLVTETMIEDLARLEERQPHCGAVIAYLRQQLALSRRAAPPVLRWPPILMDGPPGVGKTFFVRALAELFGNELTLINCSSVTANFVLAGNSPSWAGSRPGKVFDTLCQSRFANPIILLDEVDKLAGDHRFDGYGPLHQLLEKDTARHFVDEHLGLPIDASHIIWLATGNNLKALPEPILSRFHVVPIAAPDRAQSEAVVQSVYQDLLRRNSGWQRAYTRKLTPDVVHAMAGLSPREMSRALLVAMGNAALNRAQHRKLRLRLEDVDLAPRSHVPPIGFLPS